MRRFPQWRRHLDEVFVKINGKLCYLWRAVDHEGEVLETVVTAKRDKAAAAKFLKRIMKKYGRPRSVVTDWLCSYPAAMSEIGNVDRHEAGRRLNNRRKTPISRFDDESEPCDGSEAPRRSRNSAQFTLRSTSISIRNVISSPAKPTNRDARPRWPNGAQSWPDPHLEFCLVAPNGCRAQSLPILSDKASCALIAPQHASPGSKTATSAADGKTTAPRTRVSQLGEESARCKASRVRARRRDFFPLTQRSTNNFNVQRHLSTSQTHRALRSAAMTTWRDAIIAARSRDEGSLAL
jgi:DDE domain